VPAAVEPLVRVPAALLSADPTEVRRTKRRATGLLLVTTVVFLVSTLLPDTTATGFVQAAAEAGTVGASPTGSP
jgi:hypothetical protein